MARVTVSDCLKKIPNRFEMTLVGAYRARQLSAAEQNSDGKMRDKPTVLALREIASGKVGVQILRRS